MRIDKFLSNLKFGSRKEVHELIKTGIVFRNEVPVVFPNEDINLNLDVIKVGEETVFYKPSITLMMNKPEGYLSANRDDTFLTVMDLISSPYSRFDFSIAGRLDKDTTGFLLLTTDGSLLHQVISPNKEIFKTYLVSCTYPIKSVDKLEKGVTILDGKNEKYLTKPAKVRLLNDTLMEIQIVEGKFHQVKRMVEAIDNEVNSLKRISIGGLSLDSNLKPGEYKELSIQDILQIFH